MPARKTPSPTKRTTPKKTKPEGRFSSFDSAAAEWQGVPVSFEVDGTIWKCVTAPTGEILTLLGDDGATMLSFIRTCVVDKEAWDARIVDVKRPMTLALITAVYEFLLGTYFGEDLVGKA